MNTIEFSINQKQFQISVFRKYLCELKQNDKLLKGVKRLLLFVSIILGLNLIIDNVFFNNFSILIIVLLVFFFFLILKGIYDTWNEGRNDYWVLFKANEKLSFRYNENYYLYSSSLNEKSTSKTYWSDTKYLYLLPDKDILIIENNNLGTYYLNFKGADIEELFKLATRKNIKMIKI